MRKHLLASSYATLVLFAMCGNSPLRAAEVPLHISLPEPLLIGTPVPIKGVANLEKNRPGSASAVMVPEGTVNLSKDKPVTSSDAWPLIGDLAFVTDGEKGAEDGYFVELGPGTQWVQIDLERACAIHAIALWHFHSQERVYHDVIVQVSDDPEFITGVTTVFNNDHDNSSGGGLGKDPSYLETNAGRVIPVSGIKARYVRLSSRGNTANDLNHYTEVEVHGLPVE